MFRRTIFEMEVIVLDGKISVGSHFIIPTVEVLLLTGERRTYNNLDDLAEALANAYCEVLPDEIPQDTVYLRMGYQEIALKLKFSDTEESTLTFVQNKFQFWPAMGGPEVEGDQFFLYNWNAPDVPIAVLPHDNGAQLAQFLSQIKKTKILALVSLSHSAPGPAASDKFVGLVLGKADGAIAEGTILLITSTAPGETWNWLYDMEKAGQAEYL